MRRYSITAFVTGAAVMIGEIAAARAIAPHFGTSIIVWTNVIGIILVALSIGYWVGGRLSERRPDERLLGTIIALAGLLLIIPAFATRWIAGTLIADLFRLGSGFLVVLIGSFVAIILLFALPIALLGMVSPFLIKLSCEGATPSPSPSLRGGAGGGAAADASGCAPASAGASAPERSCGAWMLAPTTTVPCRDFFSTAHASAPRTASHRTTVTSIPFGWWSVTRLGC